MLITKENAPIFRAKALEAKHRKKQALQQAKLLADACPKSGSSLWVPLLSAQADAVHSVIMADLERASASPGNRLLCARVKAWAQVERSLIESRLLLEGTAPAKVRPAQVAPLDEAPKSKLDWPQPVVVDARNGSDNSSNSVPDPTQPS